MAAATIASASPYISAVSIWVMPASIPARNARIASVRSELSMCHVPWPMTGTETRIAPKLLAYMAALPFRCHRGC